MDEQTLAAMTAALVLARDYSDANPEVGMGPSWGVLLTDVERRAG